MACRSLQQICIIFFSDRSFEPLKLGSFMFCIKCFQISSQKIHRNFLNLIFINSMNLWKISIAILHLFFFYIRLNEFNKLTSRMFRTEDDGEMWYVFLSFSIITWYLEGYFNMILIGKRYNQLDLKISFNFKIRIK